MEEAEVLFKITEKINAGMTLPEILEYTYQSLKTEIPYDRIGCALLDEKLETVSLVWMKSEFRSRQIQEGYAAPLRGSSLADIVETGKPRILNDLAKYLEDHPDSESSRKLVAEGVRSSLTCPLIAQGKPIGFLFFSSRRPNTYRDAHVDFFIRIAGQLSLIAEKSILYGRVLELSETKSKFLGIVAHDLRSPLAALKTSLSVFRKFSGQTLAPETREELLSVMEKSCQHMIALIDDLVDVSAIQQGFLKLEKRPVALRKFMEDAVGFNRILAQDKSIALKLVYARNVPAKISMDARRMTQALNNLISNAVKFSEPKTSVAVRVSKRRKTLVISVTDQGQGIPEKEQKKLFEYFGKTSIRPTGEERSSGLGLAIAKRIIEAHGGESRVKSAVGQGSVFTIILPLDSKSEKSANQ